MYEKERQELVDIISEKEISDIYVLKAISEVERHKFVPEILLAHAYKDVALPIGYGQTISQPYTVAFMTQSLKVKPNSKILEIGTGSGYQAAILYKMGANVYSIERQFEIYERTRKLLDKLQKLMKINLKQWIYLNLFLSHLSGKKVGNSSNCYRWSDLFRQNSFSN